MDVQAIPTPEQGCSILFPAICPKTQQDQRIGFCCLISRWKKEDLEMSYIRPVRIDELVQFLTDYGVAASNAQELAEGLIDRFDIITESMSPQ